VNETDGPAGAMLAGPFFYRGKQKKGGFGETTHKALR